jgi:hypothetical protein
MDVTLGTGLDWAWTIIMGLVALPLISFVVQSHWSATAKRFTAVGASAVLAVLYLVAKGQIDGVPPDVGAVLVRWLVIFAGIVVVTQSIYNLVRGPLAKWESVTTWQQPAKTPPDEVPEDEPVDEAAQEVAEDTTGVPPSEVEDA